RPSPRPRPLLWPFMAPLPPPRPSRPPGSKMRVSGSFSIGFFAAGAAGRVEASGVEDADVGNLLDRLDRFGQRVRDDVDAREIEIVVDHFLAELVARLGLERGDLRLGLTERLDAGGSPTWRLC